MTNLATDLARVMELLEKATPGEWVSTWSGRSGDGYVSPANRHYTVSGTTPPIPGFMPARNVELASMRCPDPLANGPNSAAIVAAVNFLRKHGPEIAETFKETPNG